jgi:hypothetical protein
MAVRRNRKPLAKCINKNGMATLQFHLPVAALFDKAHMKMEKKAGFKLTRSQVIEILANHYLGK